MARDTNFYYSFLVLPPERRRAIVAVWDFCRAVDDAVDTVQGDQSTGQKERELGRWRSELHACFDGGAAHTPQARALSPVVRAFNLQRAHFEELIAGVEMDMRPRRYDTFADLYQYCTRVASAVGWICLDIFGASTTAARDYATDLGVAMQLTNILRDVPADLANGRLYIPLEDLRAHGCSEADLQAEAAHAGRGVRSPAVRALLAAQAARARDYYASAARALPAGEVRRVVAAEIMGAIYRDILRRIERRDYDVFRDVVRVPRPRRAVIAARVWAMTMMRGWRRTTSS